MGNNSERRLFRVGAMKSWCLLACAVVVSGAPAPQITSAPAATAAVNPSACAQVSAASASLGTVSPNAVPTVPATLAYNCLQSVPNKPEPAKQLIESLQAFVQWQSTIAFLKNPPADYMLPPTDIVGRLNNLSVSAQAGRFASEYDFQLDTLKTIASAHDGHFAFRGDIFKAFTFRNNLALDIVSVSSDGVSIPKLYHRGDLQNNTAPPAIVKINGEDAATLIQRLNLEFSPFQDPDSQWNTMFNSGPARSGSALTVAASLAFQGDSVRLTYDNGQEKTEQSFALLRTGIDFAGVTSGETFYSKFLNPDTALEQAAAAAAASTSTRALNSTARATPTSSPVVTLATPIAASPTIKGYPFPIIRDSGSNSTAGYFLNGTGYNDVAVLVLSSFASAGTITSTQYLRSLQDTISGFLAQSKASGKQKLVIDLTGNGGGFVVAGYELFAQLFPDVQMFQAHNIRLADSIVNMARVLASINNNVTPTSPKEQSALLTLRSSAIVGNLVPGGVFRPDGGSFQTVEEILAPVSLQGDLFTAYQQTPLNQPSLAFNLTGTGSRSNPPPAVFKPENIVLLTDGTCGSTCTLFSYLMIMQQNVKATVVGGRPQKGPMQSIAGVEGAQVFSLTDISQTAGAVIALAPAARQNELLNGELGTLAKGYALLRSTDPLNAGAVNGKNAFSSHDSQTPLQFLMQPANCRFFYTAEMLNKPEEVWMRTVDATWTNPEDNCVEGSRFDVNETTQAMDPLFRLAMEGGANGEDKSVASVSKGSGLLGVLLPIIAVVVVSYC